MPGSRKPCARPRIERSATNNSNHSRAHVAQATACLILPQLLPAATGHAHCAPCCASRCARISLHNEVCQRLPTYIVYIYQFTSYDRISIRTYTLLNHQSKFGFCRHYSVRRYQCHGMHGCFFVVIAINQSSRRPTVPLSSEQLYNELLAIDNVCPAHSDSDGTLDISRRQTASGRWPPRALLRDTESPATMQARSIMPRVERHPSWAPRVGNTLAASIT